VILFDALVSPDILEFARREARKILVGTTGHGSPSHQDEIRKMIELARGGRRVVRLERSEAISFGRAADTIAACRAAGIAVAVGAGIAAGQPAGARGDRADLRGAQLPSRESRLTTA